MSNPFADYSAHRQAFRALYEKQCARRILLLQGPDGSGKSTLLEAALADAQQTGIQHVFVDLDTHMGIEAILKHTELCLGNECFPIFGAESRKRSVTQASFDDIHQEGRDLHIQVEQHVHTPRDQEQRITAYTHAWFEDLRTFEKPLLLLFDGYEGALEPVQHWLSGPFLSKVAYTPWLRVVIAGEEIPLKSAWKHCSEQRKLEGVNNPEDWLHFITQLKRVLDGTLWTVALPPDCTVGTRVRITGYDGIILTVEPERQRTITHIATAESVKNHAKTRYLP